MNKIIFEGLSQEGRTFIAQKKPVEVEVHGPIDTHKKINTREGTLVAEPGDYIIRGVEGEVYPIGADIFEQTYNVVNEDD